MSYLTSWIVDLVSQVIYRLIRIKMNLMVLTYHYIDDN
jgi:hypothetical protein